LSYLNYVTWPQMACHLKPQQATIEQTRGNADSKVDSITERKPAKMGDTSRQSRTKRKPPNRLKGRTTSCLANTDEPWYNTALIKLPNNTPLRTRNRPRLKTPIYTTNNPKRGSGSKRTGINVKDMKGLVEPMET